MDRLKKWEADHGQIPAGAFVAMRIDWSKRWPDAARMVDLPAELEDCVLCGEDVIEKLLLDRGGIEGAYPFSAGRFQIGLFGSVDQKSRKERR